MTATTLRLPGNASIYELVRNRPGAAARLHKLGLSRDDMDLRLGEAARRAGVPVERIAEVLASRAD
ncbi:MAG: hypothetical protein KJ048_19120 [Dehalococcoidia bacterium]|nr:hypothetical protein [Dehalococcoidia bacterium]